MASNLDAGVIFVLRDINRVFGNLTLEIGELKAGNCSASLRRILRRLQLLEFGSFLDDLIELIVIEGLLDSSETILFLLELLSLESLRRDHLHRNTVSIFEKELLDHILENL